MHHPVYDETEIIRRCQDGDVQAFEQLYQSHAPALLGVAGRILHNHMDAEDAVQTTFIKLYGSIKRFRFQARFSSFLYRILLNVCFDQLKKRSRMQESDVVAEASFQPDWDSRLQLEQAIGELPERMRACFILFAVEQWPLQDVADAMELTLGGTKSTIFQARLRLRKWLQEKNPEVK